MLLSCIVQMRFEVLLKLVIISKNWFHNGILMRVPRAFYSVEDCFELCFVNKAISLCVNCIEQVIKIIKGWVHLQKCNVEQKCFFGNSLSLHNIEEPKSIFWFWKEHSYFLLYRYKQVLDASYWIGIKWKSLLNSFIVRWAISVPLLFLSHKIVLFAEVVQEFAKLLHVKDCLFCELLSLFALLAFIIHLVLVTCWKRDYFRTFACWWTVKLQKVEEDLFVLDAHSDVYMSVKIFEHLAWQ